MTYVTDHAVLRFIERECGFDVEKLRGLIGEVTARGAAAGAPVVRWGHVRFVLVDGAVVTTLADGHRLSFEGLKQALKAKRGRR